jgi:TolA-binding protein
MTRIVLTVLTLSLAFFAGCAKPKPAPTAVVVTGSERALLDRVDSTRQAYVQTLQQLIDYYSKMGNQMQLNWAVKEMTAINPQGGARVHVSNSAASSDRELLEQLGADRAAYVQSLQQLVDYYTKSNSPKLAQAQADLNAVKTGPKYTYHVEAEVAGPDLRAMTDIAAANKMYEEAQGLKKPEALNEYIQLIQQYPTSNKIGMAAYKAGRIYEDKGDYAIAAIYFERAAQWDKNVPFPARFWAAYMYDKYLNDSQKALLLYQDSLNHEFMNSQYRAYANNRVIIISKKEIE